MLSRCRKGLIIVSNKSFLRGGGRRTLLGKLEQEWVAKLGNAAWVDWRLVAERKCSLPHGRDTGPTPIVIPTPNKAPLPKVSSPPIKHRVPPTSPQASVPIQPPRKVSGTKERRRSTYNHTATSETPWPSLPVLEQPSKQTVVNQGAPPTSPQASVTIQPPCKVSGTKERRRSTYNRKKTSDHETPRPSLPVLEQQTVVNQGAPPTSPPQAGVPIQPPRKVSGTEGRPRSTKPTSETQGPSLPVLEPPSKQTCATVVNQGTPPTSPPRANASIQPPRKVSDTRERQRSVYNHKTTSEIPRPILPVLEQLSQRTVVSHGAPSPTSLPQASVPIQPHLKVSGTEERQRSTSNYTTTSATPRHMYNHTPVRTSGQSHEDSDGDPGQSFWRLAGVATAAYIGFKVLSSR